MTHDTPSPDMITFNGIEKKYGETIALKRVDLSVRKGEFLSLLGPSGSGKSTILNIIAGAISPSSGNVMINGEDVTRKPPRERGLGMVFQNYALLPHLNVFDNVAFPLKIRGMGKSEIKEKVENALERVGLSGFGSRKPREMSGGQQQRVGIARCIVYSPSIILMDEPLGALDKKLRDQLQIEIKRLHEEIGTTIVYVTHDQEEALNLSDRICLMHNGQIEQHGTPDELYFEPASTFVADFVGESNLLKGVLGPNQTVQTEHNLSLQVANTRGHVTGSQVSVLVRPENISLNANQNSSNMNQAHGLITQVSFVGGMTRVELTTTDGEKLLMKGLSEPAANRLTIGQPVSVHWSPSDSVLIR